MEFYFGLNIAADQIVERRKKILIKTQTAIKKAFICGIEVLF
jgi:hypothetical protein